MAKINMHASKDWKKNTRIHPILVGRFATALKAKREEKGWTHMELAEKIDMSSGYLSLLENGLRTPSLEVVEQIAKAFAVDPADLLRKEKP